MIANYSNTYKIIYNVIRGFVKHYRKKPLRIEVLKLVYLVDIEYYKKYGEKYSELDYIYYNHGPWDRSFHKLIEYMGEVEISESPLKTRNGRDFYLYTTTERIPRNDTDMIPEVSDILENLFFIYKYSDLAQMLEIVYTQEPMASTKKGERIDISKLHLNAREEREAYRKQRKKQLEKIGAIKNNMDEDDLELFAEFKSLRDRANSTI
jgi:hypothetical protein